MNLIIRMETIGKKYIYLLNEVFRPKLTISNGLNIKREGNVTVYIVTPEGEKSFIWTNKRVEIGEMDTKEFSIFESGLRLTSKYPSGLYYLVSEIEEGSIRNYDSLSFYIESRKVFCFNKSFFELKGNLSPIQYLFSHGHIHSFSNLNGSCKFAGDFKAQIQTLKKFGVNTIRISLLDMPDEASTNAKTIYPWDRVSNGKWDLLKSNETYYHRLQLFSDACKSEDMFLFVYLMDYNNLYKSHNWSYFPLNPEKNIQKSFGFPRKNLAIPEWYKIKEHNPQLYSVYTSFIETTISFLKTNPYTIYGLVYDEMSFDQDSLKYHLEISDFIKNVDANMIVHSDLFPIFDKLEIKLPNFPETVKNTEMIYNNGSWPNDRDFAKWCNHLESMKKLLLSNN